MPLASGHDPSHHGCASRGGRSWCCHLSEAAGHRGHARHVWSGHSRRFRDVPISTSTKGSQIWSDVSQNRTDKARTGSVCGRSEPENQAGMDRYPLQQGKSSIPHLFIARTCPSVWPSVRLQCRCGKRVLKYEDSQYIAKLLMNY